jgi:hypothetical protein
MAKLSSDGLSLRLDRAEVARVHRAVDPDGELDRALRGERGGFERRECIAGKHQLGTDPACSSCARYKAGAVVRKG